jgi:isopentenyl diphosphate isomerase/L-lactate dehydrogenase-like FMN-dependent dehydrogenase
MIRNNIYSSLDYKERARSKLPNFVFDFIEGGSETEDAAKRNEESFRDITLIPSIIKSKSAFNLQEHTMGLTYSAPFGIAPLGLCGLVNPNAELIFSRMAAKHNIPYVASSASNRSIDEIAQSSGVAPWFQLYIPKIESQLEILIQVAERSQCPVLVITVDASVPGRRLRDHRNGLTIPYRKSYTNIIESLMHPCWMMRRVIARRLTFPNYSNILTENPNINFSELMSLQAGGRLDWSRIAEIRQRWRKKIVLKGVLSITDAKIAQQLGIDAVILSNHGGRQLNSAPTPISILPKFIRDGLPKDFLMLDSGVTSGCDIVKSLALGASFVFIGRLFLYALAAGGESGVDNLLSILIEELTVDMKLMGVCSASEFCQEHIN